MRSISHMAFPHLPIDNGSPIVVLALKDEKDFRTLEPEAYLAKGQLKLGGLFLRAPTRTTFSCAWTPRAIIPMQ